MSEFQPITVSHRSSKEERQVALAQIYRQVLERQPYTYEHKILAKIEKDFLNDKIGVRRFLKELGHSEVYLNTFYHNSSNMKFLELSFKHFLGRAPQGQDEIRLYGDILMQEGVTKLITALLDSEEYRKVFGCFTVPYPQERKFYASPNAYLESDILNHEQIAQRGMVVPTIYWHQLGLDCNAGVCRHPEADEVLEPLVTPESKVLQDELLEILKLLEGNQVDKGLSSLSTQQQAILRRAIAPK